MPSSIFPWAGSTVEVNEKKPPPRKCPRCESDNTKFCYYNNYSVSQPRYSCKNCRRYWTHGGALRNIPIGGSSRKAKRPKVAQSLGSQVISVENHQVNHPTVLHVKENNEFSGSIGASSSEVGNHFGSFPSSHMHGGMITNLPPIQSFLPVNPLDFLDGSFEQDYYNVMSNNLIGNPLITQSISGHVDNHNSYRLNQVDQPKWNQSFNNAMNMNHNVSTSGSRGSDMNMNNNNETINNCVVYSCYLEKHGP